MSFFIEHSKEYIPSLDKPFIVKLRVSITESSLKRLYQNALQISPLVFAYFQEERVFGVTFRAFAEIFDPNKLGNDEDEGIVGPRIPIAAFLDHWNTFEFASAVEADQFLADAVMNLKLDFQKIAKKISRSNELELTV